jgi:hypothetical protein
MDELQTVPAATAAGSSIVGALGLVPFGAAVASPFFCVWRRPGVAVAGAGIAEKRSVGESRVSSTTR